MTCSVADVSFSAALIGPDSSDRHLYGPRSEAQIPAAADGADVAAMTTRTLICRHGDALDGAMTISVPPVFTYAEKSTSMQECEQRQ